MSAISDATKVWELLSARREETLRIVRQMSDAEFAAAWETLFQAANSCTERHSLLRDARHRFNTAVNLERSCRLAFSWLGLAASHILLDDETNALLALRRFTQIKLEGPPLIDRLLFTADAHDAAIRHCQQLQQFVSSTLNRALWQTQV
jgi:hypothetical protein